MGCCQHQQHKIISSKQLPNSRIKQITSLAQESTKTFITISSPYNKTRPSTPIENKKTSCPTPSCDYSFRAKTSTKHPILNKLMFKNRSTVSTMTSTNN